MSVAEAKLQLPARVREKRDALARRLAMWQRRFAPEWVISTSLGPQSLVIIETAVALGLNIPVKFIDTGFHFQETLMLQKRVQSYFGIEIEVIQRELGEGESASKAELWRSDPDVCCSLNKVEPMRQALAGNQAWITGLRSSQGGSRAIVQEEQWDPQFRLTKLSPLATWTREDVVAHVQAFSIPTNPLLQDGYPSVGCEPCTSRYSGTDERGGRWKGLAKTECGLHLPVYQPNTNPPPPPSEPAPDE